MPKLMPCPNCGTASTPTGRDYVIGRAPSRFPYRYACSHCHGSYELDAEAFHRIPEATAEEIQEAASKQARPVGQAMRFVQREVGRGGR